MARTTAWLLHLTVAAGLVAVSARAQGLHPVDQAPVPSRFVTDVMARLPEFRLQSARVVTIRFRERPVSIAPVAVPGGGAVMFTVRAEP